MKFVSWNVNGLRACKLKGFDDYFKGEDADVFCLQETKMQEGQAEIEFPGYYHYMSSAQKKGYSGTLVYSKTEPKSVMFGFDGKYSDEGRVITLEFENFYFVCVYVPNSQHSLARLPFRMVFEDDMREYLKKLSQTKPVICTGDFNVAHEAIDLRNPKENEKNAGYTIEERTKMNELLGSGLVDTYRMLNPDGRDYSWWSFRNGVRERNIGWRLDYFLVSNSIFGKVKKSAIMTKVLGSDHAPVVMEMDFDN